MSWSLIGILEEALYFPGHSPPAQPWFSLDGIESRWIPILFVSICYLDCFYSKGLGFGGF
mgnify:CR=1 FL=1|jgi:hypothetical protein